MPENRRMRTEKLKKITKIINIKTTAAVFASAVCFLSSCDSNTVYHSFQPIGSVQWEKSDGIYFDVVSAHYEGPCESFVVIRTNEKYPYKNLSVYVTSSLNDSTSAHRVDFDLTKDERRGIRHNDYIMPIRKFMIGGNDTIRVRISHNMQINKIEGITDVGIKVNKIR